MLLSQNKEGTSIVFLPSTVFEGPFELLYVDIADITFLIYTFSMKNKSLSTKKLELL